MTLFSPSSSDWWKFLLAGAIIGSLLSALFAEYDQNRKDKEWLAKRDALVATIAHSDSVLASWRVEAAAADSARKKAEHERDAARHKSTALVDSVANAKAALAKARTKDDSLQAAMVVIAQQEATIDSKDNEIAALDRQMMAATARFAADSSSIVTLTEDRDRWKNLSTEAPVGKHTKPKLLGILPMPVVVLGYGGVGDSQGFNSGVGAMVGFAILGGK